MNLLYLKRVLLFHPAWAMAKQKLLHTIEYQQKLLVDDNEQSQRFLGSNERSRTAQDSSIALKAQENQE